MMRHLHWTILPTLLLLSLAAPARAQAHPGAVSIYAYVEGGGPFRLRDASVRAVLSKGVARTDLTCAFDHDLKQQAQASVNLTIQKDAVVTGYSYWFRGERIDAKLMDNDRAWEIYHAVTSRGRDPAIMEQWGETSYHFQIYPIEPGKELRMVVHTVAPWEGDENGFFYRPPVFADAGTLRHYSAEVRLLGTGRTVVRDNLAGRYALESDALVYRLDRTDWKPEREWEIRIGGPPRRLVAMASGGRSDGPEGFFYLLLASPHEVGPSRLHLSGMATRLVMPAATGGLPAGMPWLVTGRYHGSGVLNVTLQPRRGNPLHARVRLTAGRAPNGPATKFWASRYVKRLGQTVDAHAFSKTGPSRRRTVVVRLSQRFGVTSAYTAWLAIPQSELAVYRKMTADPEFRRQQLANRAATNVPATRGGDPLIRIETTPDVRSVTAILPTGEAVPLERKRGNAWEGRFDIPWGTAEGSYEVVVQLQSEDGTRKRVRLSYEISRSAPSGAARLAEGILRVTASGDVVRVVARSADGVRTELKATGDGVFSTPWSGAAPVEITLIDRAHNVTVIHVSDDVTGLPAAP